MNAESGNGVDPIFQKILHSKTKRWLFRIGCVLCAIFLISTIVLAILYASASKDHGSTAIAKLDQPLPTFPTQNDGVLGNFSRAAVAADNGICSEIGRNILVRGGNAVDSMIATLLCIGVLDAHSTGLGGGHFTVIYNRTTKTCLVIDAREKAPKAATPDMYGNDSNASKRGWLAVGVPGEIYGLYTAYKLAGSGKVPWHDLVTPAADLCHFGHPVSGALARAIVDQKDYIMKEPTLKELFVNKQTNELYVAGEILRRPALASTLYALAQAPDPIQWFYHSNLTQTMAAEFQKNGGVITVNDFQGFTAEYGAARPVITTKLGSDLIACGPPPPSSAAVTMAFLNVMQGYNITPSKLENADYQVETYHRWLETMKFIYGARTKLGDMDFVKEALNVARNITSPEYGAFIRSLISAKAHDNMNYYLQDGRGAVEDHGTSHVSVLDEEGNAASVTSSVNLYFGAHVISPSTGIIWNDQMDDFANPRVPNFFGLPPWPANLIEPEKRPLSSMSPIIVYNATTGDVKIVTGSAGGSRIISAIAQLIARILWFGQNVKEAIEWPRLHNQLQPFVSEYSPGFPQTILDKLIQRGQNFTRMGTFSTAATAIHRGDDGRIYANSDYRKVGGYPTGY